MLIQGLMEDPTSCFYLHDNVFIYILLFLFIYIYLSE